jgi:hypothetical protein
VGEGRRQALVFEPVSVRACGAGDEAARDRVEREIRLIMRYVQRGG